MEVGRHQIPHLPQGLPILGFFPLLFLEGHFPENPVMEIPDGFPDGLGLLTHGVPAIPNRIKPVQQRAEAVGLLQRIGGAVLEYGHKGVGFGGSVGLAHKIGPGLVPQMVLKISMETAGCLLQIRVFQPSVHIPQHGKGHLPAHQGRQAPEGVHEPVRQPIGAGSFQKLQNLIFLQAQRGTLAHRLRLLIGPDGGWIHPVPPAGGSP